MNYRFYILTELRRGISIQTINEQLLVSRPDEAPSRATLYRLAKEFKATGTIDRKRTSPGHPISTTTGENVTKVQEMMAENKKISARQIADELQLSKDTVWRILTIQLEKRKVCSVWVTHNLSAANRAARVTSCIAMLQLFDEFNEEELLTKWATEDKSWFNYHPLPTN